MKNIFLILLIIASCSNNPANSKKNDEINLESLWIKNTNNIAAPKTPPLVIEGSKVIYTGEVELKALDIDDGTELWSGIIDNEISLVSYILVFDNELNRVLSNHKESFKAWDTDTGELIFSLGKNHDIEAWGVGRNSLINNGYGVVGDTLDAYALNIDGSIRFKIDTDYETSGVSYSEAKIFLSQGKNIHGELTLGKIRAFNSNSGDSLWTYYTTNSGFIWSSSIVEEKILYAGTWGNSPKREVTALNSESGEVIWKYITDDQMEYTESILVGLNYVYSGAGGTLLALDKQTGKKAWRFDWTSSTLVRPVYLEGYVYHSDHNRLFVLDAETGELVHEEPLPEGGGFFWHLAVSSDKLFAQTSRQLIAYQPWHLREE